MTDTYNPILSKEPLARLSRLVAEPGMALVLSGQGQPLVTITHNEKGLTTWERISGKYQQLYKVDMTEHPLTFHYKLPCATDDFDFLAEVKFICSVADPKGIIRRNVTDVSSILESLIHKVMRFVSCNYEISQRKVAEQEISICLETAVYDPCFQVKHFILTLSLPEEVKYTNQDVKRVWQETAIKRAEVLSGNEIDGYRQQLLRQQINFYSDILKGGEPQLLAMHLAQRPDDVQIIMQLINQQKQLEREQHMKMLKMLLDEDVIEGWQISDSVKRQLQQVFGQSEQSIPAFTSKSTNQAQSEKVMVVDQTGRNVSPPPLPPQPNSPSLSSTTPKALPPKPAPPPQITVQSGKPVSSQSQRIADQPSVPNQSTNQTSDFIRPQFNYDEDE